MQSTRELFGDRAAFLRDVCTDKPACRCWLLCHRSEINRFFLERESDAVRRRYCGGVYAFVCFSITTCVHCRNNTTPSEHVLHLFILSLPLINLVFCVSSSEVYCLCVCCIWDLEVYRRTASDGRWALSITDMEMARDVCS